MTPELIIFDCDGVLVDSELITNRVFADMLAGIGLPLGIDYLFEHFVGRSMQHCWQQVGRLLGHEVPAAFRDEFQLRSLAALRAQVQPVPGVVTVLDSLPVPCCVASSGGHDKMATTLGATGLLPRFRDRMFSATEVPHGKPAPDIFLYAAARCGVEPQRCAVIEDSAAGVRAGVTAGMRVYGYCAHTPARQLLSAGAEVTFTDMVRLPELLFGQKVSALPEKRLD
ncbi:MAG: HAD family hydrolase [Proteobacteria bacterium]|nr:HAD family hydrolase [Pseudomonadota bacterium]